jgi:signal transduction histidine kinase
MSTRQKILFALLATLVMAVISSIIAFWLNNRQELLITNHNIEQHNHTCKAAIDIQSSKVNQIVYDYSFWDDYVTFIKKPSHAWGKENISNLVTSYDLDAVWMLNLDNKVIYSDFSKNAKLLFKVSFDSILLNQLYKNRFTSFYLYTPIGLVMVHGATIHPTSDAERLTMPHGYIFLAKVWDSNLIEKTEKLSGSEILILNGKQALQFSPANEIQFSITVENWQNENVGVILFSKKLPFMDLYRRTSMQMLILFIFTALSILIILAFLLSKWVSKPLSLVSEAIATENIDSLSELKKGSGDFQRIAILIDEFIKQKKELTAAKNRAEEADSLKTAFLANMSHEIRTPLFGVLGFAELLKEKELTDEVRLNHIEIILNSGHHLLSLINDIIDLSKIESGIMTINCEQFNVDELMLELYQFYMNNRLFKDHDVKLKLSTELHDESIAIETDRKRVKQVLTNLLSNSLKFTTKGEIEFGYKIIAKNELVFYVRDTGIGIARDQHDKIFDRFIQVDNRVTSRQFEGTGLGLSISKALVEHVGGRIWVESELNCGSLFSFTLPVDITISSDTSHLIVSNAFSSFISKPNLNGKKVLVVDDFEHNILLFNSMLEKVGCSFFSATNGNQAIEIIRQTEGLDLVLLDIRLADRDGFAIAREIRKLKFKVAIIAHTAYVSDDNRRMAIAAGCNDFFTKPISEEDLIKIISKTLNFEK